MSRKRKSYRPRAVDLDPIGLAIGGASLLSLSQRTLLLEPIVAAIDAFCTTTATLEHWLAMADALNVAEVLAESGIASDRQPEFRAAQAALAAIHSRHNTGTARVATATECHALREAVFLHRVQLEHCSQRELRDAIKTVQRRVAAALAGNASPQTTVCAPGVEARAAGAKPFPIGLLGRSLSDPATTTERHS